MMKPLMVAVGFVQHGMRADQGGDHVAPVDVADQNDRHVGGAGEAHIGDVALAG
jgi:hypothetical protein